MRKLPEMTPTNASNSNGLITTAQQLTNFSQPFDKSSGLKQQQRTITTTTKHLMAENSWHWKHYHEFKTPNFNDYSSDDNFDDDNESLSSSSSSSSSSSPANGTLTRNDWTPLWMKNNNTTTNWNPLSKTEINSERTSWKSWDHLAQLSCDSGEMILRLNFTEPFKGIVYPDNNRLSPCRFFGDGHHNYELRLPLRGCGTKQVAQRVFVNDVIVRFHKSLELEEDEVKTLICRYPPPLTATAPTTSHQQQQQQPTQRPLPNGEQENGQNQFEFIEQQQQQQQQGRQPTSSLASGVGFNRQPIGSANGNGNGGAGSELTNDNLVVASPGGHQSYDGTVQELVPSLATYDRASPSNGNGQHYQQQNGRFSSSMPTNAGRPNADLIDQRSSAPDAFSNIIGSGGGVGGQPTRTAASSSGLSGYFERLTSIELLFLISSLMFLILLGLGLAGGYFCFRRQAANQRQASAILRRKRRFMGNSSMLAPPQISSTGLLAAPPPSMRATARNNHHHLQQQQQQYYQQQPQLQQQQQRHHHPPAPPTTSSPESDLSGRGLLASTSRANAADVAHQQPRPSNGYMFNNQAFVPDPMMLMPHNRSTRHKSGGPVPPPKPVIGRRGDLTGTYGRGGYPIDGRGGHMSMTQQQQQQHHHHHRAHRLPLNQHLYSMNDISAGSKYGRHGLHRAQQVYVDHGGGTDHVGEPQLSRAKSLTYVGPSPTEQVDIVPPGRRWHLDQQPPLMGGTLARYPRNQTKDHHHHHHHHQHQHQHRGKHRHSHYVPSSHVASKNLEPIRDNNNHNKHNNNNKYGDAWLHVSSDSELEPNNNNNNNSKQRSFHHVDSNAGKGLFLKSIEDSYITKFTEVEEQEYMKRDSLRPFGLSEWRDKIAEQQAAKQYNQNKRRNNNNHQPNNQSGEASSYKSTTSHENDEDDADDDADDDLPPPVPVLKSQIQTATSSSPEAGEYRSANTNLRSLTELDVNFAKSLLRTSKPQMISNTSKETTAGEVNLRPSTSSSSSSSSSSGDNDHEKDKDSRPTGNDKVEKQDDDDDGEDLIVSPEYDLTNNDNRLELSEEPTGGADASRNSVSYV